MSQKRHSSYYLLLSSLSYRSFRKCRYNCAALPTHPWNRISKHTDRGICSRQLKLCGGACIELGVQICCIHRSFSTSTVAGTWATQDCLITNWSSSWFQSVPMASCSFSVGPKKCLDLFPLYPFQAEQAQLPLPLSSPWVPQPWPPQWPLLDSPRLDPVPQHSIQMWSWQCTTCAPGPLSLLQSFFLICLPQFVLLVVGFELQDLTFALVKLPKVPEQRILLLHLHFFMD